MKIDITCYPFMGDSGIIATELGIRIAERGHEVHFITSNIPFRICKLLPNMMFHQAEVNQYAVFQYPSYDITLSTEISDVIQEYDLDILHIHYAVPHAMCSMLAEQMSGRNAKVMTILRGTGIAVLGYGHTLQNAIKFSIERSDIVAGVSHSLAQWTYEIINTRKETIPIYNFVRGNKSPTQHNEELKDCYGISSEERVLVHVSNFRKVKRIDTVIETFTKVHENMPSKLILLGNGPELIDMRHKARELGAETHVLFLGRQDGINAFYQLSDLVLLLSEKESSGLTPLEAMKTGVLPIGSHASGIKEVIRHGETGFIVDMGDSTRAAKYAIKLLSNPELYQKMQSQMLKDIEARFSSDLTIDQYGNYYRKILEQGEDSNES